MKDMKVIFSDTSRDFSPWVREKCQNLLIDLCWVIKESPEIVNNAFFTNAFDDALKLYALSHGNLNGIRCGLVNSLLFRYNVDGYYFLEDLIFKRKQSAIMEKIMCSKHDEEILVLIEQNDKSNRQKLAVLLAQSDQTNPWILNIAEDLEYVHNGEKTWEWFYDLHKNDRNTFTPYFEDSFIQKVYDYFHSDDYFNADI